MKHIAASFLILIFNMVCVLSVLAEQRPVQNIRGASLKQGGESRLLAVQSGSGSTQPTDITVVVHPENAPVTSKVTQPFNAVVSGTSNDHVTWYVDGIQGGNAKVGTIDGNGLYSPPSSFAVGHHTVKAVSQADETKSGKAAVFLVAYAGMYTSRNDNSRTGQNLKETVLTPANVTSTRFEKLFSFPIDGGVHAQPLYVANVNVPNPLNGSPGYHNVVYVATEHDSVFAFDADGKVSGPLWQAVFINPPNIVTIPGSCLNDVTAEIGITATPTIDPASNTIYVEARTLENPTGQCAGTFVHKLHALDITTGEEKFGGPVIVQASVPGTGSGSVNGTLSFNPKTQNVRPGLLLSKSSQDVNSIVYLGSASLEDNPPFHGWILGYDSQTLALKYVYNTTPNGGDGGVWQLGAGLSADARGSIFVQTGNGSFDNTKDNFGQSLLKLTPSNGSLRLTDYFTPANWKVLNSHDWDMSSGGVLLLPNQQNTSHPHVMVGGGKEGTIYVVDRDHLGKFHSGGDTILQEIVGAIRASVPDGSYYGIWGTAGYFNNNVYIFGHHDYPKMFKLNNGLLPTTATSTGTTQMKSPSPVFSANGSRNGLVWILQYDVLVLSAFDPNDLTHEYYNTNQNKKRDQLKGTIDVVTPTVANGRVYVPTVSQLVVYGLVQ